MQNSNGSPWLLTDRGNPDSAAFPRYVVGERDNRRSQNARRLLAARERWSFEDLVALASDTRVLAADSLLPELLAAFDARPAGDAARARYAPAIGYLRSWNRVAAESSVAMTVFATWRGFYDAAPRSGALPALDSALRLLDREGGWQRPWGEVNRLQRWDALAGEGPDDARPSISIRGVNSGDGAVFTFNAPPDTLRRRRYGRSGATYVSVVEFGRQTRAVSVHVFGSSGDPRSPHWQDQSSLYAAGRFKPAWTAPRDIRANLESSYRP
jgi:acyl-homoserine-lactone acylase